MPKKRGNSLIGGDKKTRDRMNRLNPRGSKKGGRRSKNRGKIIKVKSLMEDIKNARK